MAVSIFVQLGFNQKPSTDVHLNNLLNHLDNLLWKKNFVAYDYFNGLGVQLPYFK